MAACQDKDKTSNVRRFYSPLYSKRHHFKGFNIFNICKMYLIKVMHLIVFSSLL